MTLFVTGSNIYSKGMYCESYDFHGGWTECGPLTPKTIRFEPTSIVWQNRLVAISQHFGLYFYNPNPMEEEDEEDEEHWSRSI